jgi:hypothetical protein
MAMLMSSATGWIRNCSYFEQIETALLLETGNVDV